MATGCSTNAPSIAKSLSLSCLVPATQARIPGSDRHGVAEGSVADACDACVGLKRFTSEFAKRRNRLVVMADQSWRVDEKCVTNTSEGL
jgi:hypothetical protein